MTNPSIEQLVKDVVDAKQRLNTARNAAAARPVSDYAFTDADGGKVMLSSLFAANGDLIVVHNMGKSCPYCTVWADGFIGLAKHLQDRGGFALTTPDDYKSMGEFARSRGWPYRVLSHKGTTFARDMGVEPEPGSFWPGVSGFRREADGSMRRTGFANFGPGDDFCAMWPMLDLLPSGVGDWKPKYQY